MIRVLRRDGIGGRNQDEQLMVNGSLSRRRQNDFPFILHAQVLWSSKNSRASYVILHQLLLKFYHPNNRTDCRPTRTQHYEAVPVPSTIASIPITLRSPDKKTRTQNLPSHRMTTTKWRSTCDCESVGSECEDEEQEVSGRMKEKRGWCVLLLLRRSPSLPLTAVARCISIVRCTVSHRR